MQTPTTPVPAPPPPPAEPEAPPILDLKKLGEVKEGMSESEVMALLGRPGFLMSQSGETTSVYRWAEPGGPVLLARFEEGKLSRKNVINGGAEDASEKPGLSEDKYNALTQGMSLEEALSLLEVEPRSQTTGGDGTSIVRWQDAHGSSFTARFEQGKLVRKTGFHVSAKKSTPEAETAPGPTAEEAPVPDAASATESVPEEDPAEPAATEPATEETAPAESSSRARPRVSVAGKSRRQGDEADRGSYNPPAKLPEFTHGLRKGSFEIRINNPSEHEVKAGLRLGDRGVDVSIPAGGHRSVKVDRGNYGFYFVSDGDPYTLNGGGGAIDLNSMFATDLEIDLIDENYEVRVLNAYP